MMIEVTLDRRASSPIRLIKEAKHEADGTQEAHEYGEHGVRVVGFSTVVVASIDEETVGQNHHPNSDQEPPQKPPCRLIHHPIGITSLHLLLHAHGSLEREHNHSGMHVCVIYNLCNAWMIPQKSYAVLCQ
uniref:Uncharacterized protein n=1 Tax=Oryza brachyantha TaxID=4533 RepID=J3MGS8_ORYBR